MSDYYPLISHLKKYIIHSLAIKNYHCQPLQLSITTTSSNHRGQGEYPLTPWARHGDVLCGPTNVEQEGSGRQGWPWAHGSWGTTMVWFNGFKCRDFHTNRTIEVYGNISCYVLIAIEIIYYWLISSYRTIGIHYIAAWNKPAVYEPKFWWIEQ